jgi:hypothetical protein
MKHHCFDERTNCPFGWTPFAGWVLLEHAGLDTSDTKISRIAHCPYCGDQLADESGAVPRSKWEPGPPTLTIPAMRSLREHRLMQEESAYDTVTLISSPDKTLFAVLGGPFPSRENPTAQTGRCFLLTYDGKEWVAYSGGLISWLKLVAFRDGAAS